MKSNNGSGNVPERDEWQTNQELWNKLDKQYKFNFDCCASEDNVKTEIYTSNFLSFVGLSKCEVGWMNPPFSKAMDMFKHFFKVVKSGVAIYRCDNMETKIWQDVILPNATWIFIPKGRINYEGMDGKGSRFPSALIGLNVPPPKEMEGNLLKT